MEEEKITEEEQIPKKKKIGIKILIFLLVLLVLLFGYMFYIEPKELIIKEYPIINEKIPESFNGFKIVQFSDLHFGSSITEKEATKIMEKINELKPDILIFTGDLIEESIEITEKSKNSLKETLSKMSASLFKFAIKGDQDFKNSEEWNNIMSDTGFTILENQNVPIYYKGNAPIYIGGISSIAKQKPDLTKTFLKEEPHAYQILLLHEPILFNEVSRDADLVLAGHTLGGHIHIPFYGGLLKLNNTEDYMTGIFKNSNSTMVVNTGLGTEKINARFLNPPSISLFRLYNY